MSTHDNASPPADWQPQPGRHCGQFCFDRECSVCGVTVPPNVVLGES